MAEKKEKATPTYYWDPLNMLQEMERAFDSFRLRLGDMAFTAGTMISPRIPAVDCREEEDAYVLEAELPGLKREDISIDVGEDAIYIKAQKEEKVEEKREGYIRKERGSLSFYRRIPISKNVDKENVSAKLEDGVLRVTLPKMAKPEETKKKIDIE